jgi:hypothetical protein
MCTGYLRFWGIAFGLQASSSVCRLQIFCLSRALPIRGVRIGLNHSLRLCSYHFFYIFLALFCLFYYFIFDGPLGMAIFL